MFCPNCGKQIPDNAAFCSECGKPTNTVSAPEPTPVATPTIPVGKIKYFTKVAPTSKRIMAGIALGLGLLCILFVFLSANTTVNGSIFETPIFSLYNEDSEEIQAEFDQIAKDLEKF